MLKKQFLLILFFVFVFMIDSWAQCSMCRLAAETSFASGSEIGKGLNNGILYIMIIPYILFAILALILFSKPIRSKVLKYLPLKR